MRLKLVLNAAAALLLCLTILRTSTVFAKGGVAGGGGNTVKDKLFDDYENEGTEQIEPSLIRKLAEPVLVDLDKKVPGFAKLLRKGVTGIIWYREPKLLGQNGICRNGSETGLTPPIDQVVRACQNSLDVRIEQKWFDDQIAAGSSLPAGLVVHELLVFQRIRSVKISEEGVLRISRDIRSLKLSAEQLQTELDKAGFGSWATKSQLEGFAGKRSISLL